MAKTPKTETPAPAPGDADPQGTEPNPSDASAADQVDAQVTKGSGSYTLGAPVAQVLDPAHAMAEIKAKVGVLHAVVHNVGHFSTLAFDDVEALVADIAKLSNFIRSKV